MAKTLNKLVYEAALKEAPFQAIAVVAVEPVSGEIAYVSEPAETMFGYGPDELVGEPVEILLPDELRKRHVEHRKRFAESPRSRPMGSGLMLRGKRKDGSIFPVQVGLLPTNVLEKEVVAGIVFDMTEPIRTATLIEHVADEMKHEIELDRVTGTHS